MGIWTLAEAPSKGVVHHWEFEVIGTGSTYNHDFGAGSVAVIDAYLDSIGTMHGHDHDNYTASYSAAIVDSFTHSGTLKGFNPRAEASNSHAFRSPFNISGSALTNMTVRTIVTATSAIPDWESYYIFHTERDLNNTTGVVISLGNEGVGNDYIYIQFSDSTGSTLEWWEYLTILNTTFNINLVQVPGTTGYDVTFYVNGVQKYTTNVAEPINIYQSSGFTIGDDHNNQTIPFDGVIEEFSILNVDATGLPEWSSISTTNEPLVGGQASEPPYTGPTGIGYVFELGVPQCLADPEINTGNTGEEELDQNGNPVTKTCPIGPNTTSINVTVGDTYFMYKGGASTVSNGWNYRGYTGPGTVITLHGAISSEYIGGQRIFMLAVGKPNSNTQFQTARVMLWMYGTNLGWENEEICLSTLTTLKFSDAEVVKTLIANQPSTQFFWTIDSNLIDSSNWKYNETNSVVVTFGTVGGMTGGINDLNPDYHWIGGSAPPDMGPFTLTTANNLTHINEYSEFNGTDSHVLLEGSITYNGPITLMFWVELLGVTNNDCMIYVTDSANQHNNYTMHNTSYGTPPTYNGGLNLGVYPPAGGDVGATSEFFDSQHPGKVLVTYVRDGTNGYWYANGVLIAGSSGSPFEVYTGDPLTKLYLGAYAYNNSIIDHINMRISNFAYWDSALTEQQIATLIPYIE